MKEYVICNSPLTYDFQINSLSLWALFNILFRYFIQVVKVVMIQLLQGSRTNIQSGGGKVK